MAVISQASSNRKVQKLRTTLKRFSNNGGIALIALLKKNTKNTQRKVALTPDIWSLYCYAPDILTLTKLEKLPSYAPDVLKKPASYAVRRIV